MSSSFIDRESSDLKSRGLWKAAAAELLGTLMLVLFGSGAGIFDPAHPHTAPSSVHVALEPGFYIAVIVTVLGNVSGGHVNPAISIGFVVTREITIVRFVVYVVAQTTGGIAGAGLLFLMTPASLKQGSFGVISPGVGVTDGQAVICEFTITFLLLFGTFAMIDSGRTDIHGSVPLMIGFIVCINVFFAVSNYDNDRLHQRFLCCKGLFNIYQNTGPVHIFFFFKISIVPAG